MASKNTARDDFALDVVDRLITSGVHLAIDHEKAGRSLSGESSHLEVPREVAADVHLATVDVPVVIGIVRARDAGRIAGID
eukprot:CAMPEP_0203989372 /NCGR_PEP_ID=MMETSP0360-20130528/8080_1 /ASSEMBLY_ACC=CAM_ASM_000342 /TAXON_ID=268821 /ORGANISM="Scrippsiella Hangoei, Strain SHTV-5" /LENGTH=80 /DNA_ID=CAMNT_0050929271 /DNA_START=61 /DNA_END=301 /DNA_ORIENTATION=+